MLISQLVWQAVQTQILAGNHLRWKRVAAHLGMVSLFKIINTNYDVLAKHFEIQAPNCRHGYFGEVIELSDSNSRQGIIYAVFKDGYTYI